MPTGLNVAALFAPRRTVLPSGHEAMFGVNHLGPFLLTHLLRGQLGDSARVITVTAPSTSRLDFDDLMGAQKWSGLNRFGRTKMCNLLFAYELARQLEGTGATSNAVHPGLVKSGLLSDAAWIVRVLASLVSSGPEQTGAGIAWLASAEEHAGVSGTFWHTKDRKRLESNDYSPDPDHARRLWRESERLLGLT